MKCVLAVVLEPKASIDPTVDETSRAALRLLDAVSYTCDPESGQMIWSDINLAMRITGQTTPEPLISGELFIQLLPDAARSRRDRFVSGGPTAARGPLRLEYAANSADGRVCWVQELIEWSGGEHPMLTGVLRNIADQKRREGRLAMVAARDDLTGLLPRDRLCEASELTAAQAQSNGEAIACVSFAIDDLGALNTRFGVDVADQLIASVASRLEREARPTDIIGRTAGNKLGMLMVNCPADRVEKSVRRLRDAICKKVIQTAGGPINVSISAGVAVATTDTVSGRALLTQAEASLDLAKRFGPGEVHIAQQDTSYLNERALVAEKSTSVLTAMRDDRLVLQFQPIVDARTRVAERYECLARLRGLDGKLGAGADFVAAAEASGLVRMLDERVLRLAGQALAEHPDVSLSVNVSGATVRQASAVDTYLKTLADIPADHLSRLCVELTETCVVDSPERAVDFAHCVRELGSRFSVDDFGAGYTSFRHLKALVPDEVKIDGVYANGVAQSPSDLSFVQALVHLARALKMEVVAEWVGDEADATALSDAGVDCLQGRLFGLAGELPKPGRAA